MPPVRQIISSDPERLLRAAAAGFFEPHAATRDDPFPSPPYLLALRQGGLRDDLIRMAAAAGVRGWFDPPLCLLAELPRRLGAGGGRALGALERQVLLGSLLRTSRDEVFGTLRDPEAYVAALDVVIGELVAEGIEPDALERALVAVRAAEGAARRDDFDRRRDGALLDLYRRYLDALLDANRTDGRDGMVQSARIIERDPAALAARLGGRREIRIVGLADLRGGWRRLLAALAGSPALDAVALYGTHVLPLSGASPAPFESLDDGASLAARLFTDTALQDAGGAVRPAVVSAPDTAREMEHVAVQVRALVAGGVAPHRIAVVSRDARPHGDLARAVLERLGVPVSARRRIGLRDVPAVRALMALLAAAADGWTRHGLAELAEQPYIGTDLDARVINHVGFRRAVSGLAAWREELDALLEEALAHERAGDDDSGAPRHRHPPPPSSRVRLARRAFAALAEKSAVLDRERPLGAWLTWLDDLLRHDSWGIAARIYRVPDDEFAIARADLAAWKQLGVLVADWREALATWGGRGPQLDAQGFHEQLDGALSGDVAFAVGGSDGVQVLEALAAAYRSFDHVFIAGLESGRHPRPVPRSYLLGPDDRAALAAAGLPIEQAEDWEGRERELFRVLLAAARQSLTLSWSRTDAAGELTVRSAFIEETARHVTLDERSLAGHRVSTPGLALVASPEAARIGERVARIERSRQTGALSRWNGLIEDAGLLEFLRDRFGDAYLWSPTQLESYAKCPWSWFSERLLHLEARAEPDDSPEASVRGTVLHAALQSFYDRERQARGAPVLLREADRARALAGIVAALHEAMDRVGDEEWMGNAALRDVLRAEMARTLEGFIGYEIAQNELYFNSRSKRSRSVRTGVDRSELELDVTTLERGDVRLRYRGTVDRVGRGVDDRFPSSRFIAAVDYKRTKSSTPGGGDPAAWDDGVVLQVPMYAHALRQMSSGDELVRVEYRAIRNCERVHTLEFYRIETKGNAPEPDDAARSRMEAALDAAAEHVRGVRTGRFPAHPAPSCGCPPFCQAWDICRTRGGPHTTWEGH